MSAQDLYTQKLQTRLTEDSALVVNNLSGGGSVDLTSPPTSIGTTTPVAVNSTIFTALPANNTSAFVASGNTLTGANAQSLVDLSQTWNTSGTPTAIFANITDTASNAASNLIDLRVGGSTRFKIAKGGAITQADGQFFDGAWLNSGSYIGNNSTYGVRQSAGTIVWLTLSGNGFTAGATRSFGWFSSDSTSLSGSRDLILLRDAANTLAQRNSTSSQTSRLYKSFTDASNYTRSAWQFDASGVVIAGESAGTGDANIDVTLTPKGTGNVRFGAHSAVAAEVITGYITIKDASGTLRKLAVIS